MCTCLASVRVEQRCLTLLCIPGQLLSTGMPGTMNLKDCRLECLLEES